jgi:phenylacetate-CoA ligase
MAKVRLESWIWDRLHERMPREELGYLQGLRLAAAVRRAYERVPLYRAKLNAAGVQPADIRGIDDVRRLPFTTKDELRDAKPFGLLAVRRTEVVRVHPSSGTTGKPTVVSYTHRDLALWTDLIARALAASGVRPGVVLQNAYGYGLFTGGLGFQYGAERIGALVVPAGGGNPERQLTMLRDFGSGVLLCTPSFAATILDAAGNEARDLPVAAGIFGGEPSSEALRARLEAGFGIRAHDTYGLSEVIGPGVAHECAERSGPHLYEDHFFPEIIDPETEEPVGEGEPGELVLTAMTREASPLLRYRTRDRTRFLSEPCRCGRTLRRIERVSGRTEDVLTVRGRTVVPQEVEEVLLSMGELEPQYQIAHDRREDALEVRVEVADTIRSDPERMGATLRRSTAALRARFGEGARVQLVPARSLPRSEGKAKRVVSM